MAPPFFSLSSLARRSFNEAGCLLLPPSSHHSVIPIFLIFHSAFTAALREKTLSALLFVFSRGVQHPASRIQYLGSGSSSVSCLLNSVFFFSLLFPALLSTVLFSFLARNPLKIKEDRIRRPHIENKKSPISQFPGHGALSLFGSEKGRA